MSLSAIKEEINALFKYSFVQHRHGEPLPPTLQWTEGLQRTYLTPNWRVAAGDAFRLVEQLEASASAPVEYLYAWYVQIKRFFYSLTDSLPRPLALIGPQCGYDAPRLPPR